MNNPVTPGPESNTGEPKILLEAVDLYHSYDESSVPTAVLKGVSLKIYDEKLTAIIGKSGSGKSTLLHVLATLDTPQQGSILFDNTELTTLSSNQKAAFRNRSLGFIYQFHHLLNDLTALDNVMLPLLIAGVDKQEAKERAMNYLKKVGLEGRAGYKPKELSGGQRQRAAIARALVHKPKLILADEPTGNLDADNSAKIFDLFLNMVREDKVAVVMVTHDKALAGRCDYIYEIEYGKISLVNDLSSALKDRNLSTAQNPGE